MTDSSLSSPALSPAPSPSASVAGELSAALSRAIERTAPSVVRIASAHGQPTSGTVWSDDGLILTTHGGTRRAARRGHTLTVYGHDEREREATVVGRDAGTDLVLLRVDAGHTGALPAVARTPSDALPQLGTLALALARPGWCVRASLRMLGLIGPGFRTQRGGRIDAWLESDRTLPRGFSGGPLIDVDGRMLGLSSRSLVPHADLALPLSTIERVVAELLEHGVVRHGWLGVSLIPVEVPADAGAESRTAVLTAGLEADGPAARDGLLIGDLIVALDDAPIASPADLREALRGKIDVAVDLSLLRAGQATRVSVTPTHRPG